MKGFIVTGLAVLMTSVSSGLASTPDVGSASLTADTLTPDIAAQFKNLNSTTTGGIADARSDHYGHHG